MKKLFLMFFTALAVVACVEDNPYTGITGVSHDPVAPTAADAVTVTATTVGLNAATLFYTVGTGATQSVSMTGGEGTFKGTIPAQADGAHVTYQVRSGKAQSDNKSYTVTSVVFDYSQLVLNEIDGNNKFVELFNKGTVELPLTGCKIIKNEGGDKNGPGTQVWWTGEDASGVIAPNGYVVIIADANPDNSALVGGAGISSKQNVKFELFAPDGASLSLFTRGTAPWVQTTISDVKPNSYQCIPNGSTTWLMAEPTKGAENAATGAEIPQQ